MLRCPCGMSNMSCDKYILTQIKPGASYLFRIISVPCNLERVSHWCQRVQRQTRCYTERVSIPYVVSDICSSICQLVGSKGSVVDVPRRGFVLYTKRVLHVLGQLRFSYRCYHIHPPRFGSSCRLRPLMDGNVSGQLAELRFGLMAMDSHWLNCCYVHSVHHPDWHSLRLFRKFWMHSQPLLYLIQPRPLHYHHYLVHTSSHTRVESSVGPRSIWNGRCILYLSRRVCCEQSRTRSLQSAQPD